jgi:hypothetical protein
MYENLWDPEQEFFVDVIRRKNANLNPIHGREEVGFYPFRFGIGLNASYADPAINQLFDPNGFLTEYGPTTIEVRNKYYTADKPSDYCCFWQGQSWPFSTAHTLKSLADLVRSGQSKATPDNYLELLHTYAITQYKNGSPYVAESHYPERDAWSADSFNHSEHYMHSTNNNNLITGLLGIVPRADDMLEISPIVPSNWTYFAIENAPYHGHLISVLYDQDGSRYGAGMGLSVYVDGKRVHRSQKSKTAMIALSGNAASQPNVDSEAAKPIEVNVAANPLGVGHWPKASATYTFSSDDPYKAIDGVLFYDSEPDNRHVKP